VLLFLNKIGQSVIFFYLEQEVEVHLFDDPRREWVSKKWSMFFSFLFHRSKSDLDENAGSQKWRKQLFQQEKKCRDKGELNKTRQILAFTPQRCKEHVIRSNLISSASWSWIKLCWMTKKGIEKYRMIAIQSVRLAG
jgi:hypothetical protein